MSLTQCHYDKPQSHSNTQTRWVLPSNKNIWGSSLKLLDIKMNPNVPGCFPVLVGAYACVKRVQIRLDGKEVDMWYSKSSLPYLLAQMGDNERQKNMNQILYGTGNNVVYDAGSKLLALSRPLVDTNLVVLKLKMFSNLLDNIGIVNNKLEIIIDWETDPAKVFCPLNQEDTPVASYTISAPYLSYETFNEMKEQPEAVVFTQWVEDEWVIPAIAADNTSQEYQLRSNAFNKKTIGRLLLSNIPSNLDTNEDVEALYWLFNTYLSVPMKFESFNIAKEGRNILTFRNVSNDAVKLSIAHDSWGQSNFITNGHVHSVASCLKELQGVLLNGFASFGCCEVNDFINKELQMTYRRTSDVVAQYPSLAQALIIKVVAEVKCELVNGVKEYI